MSDIKDVDFLCERLCAMKLKKMDLEEKIDEIQKEMYPIEKQIEAILEESGKENWKTSAGNIELRRRTSVKIPRDEPSKRALFNWLTERGIFYETVGVNANTLNALYKSEFEVACEEGRECVIPGISSPEIFTTVVIKPKR